MLYDVASLSSRQLPKSELQYLVSQSALVESDWSVTQNVPAAREGLMEPLSGNLMKQYVRRICTKHGLSKEMAMGKSNTCNCAF